MRGYPSRGVLAAGTIVVSTIISAIPASIPVVQAAASPSSSEVGPPASEPGPLASKAASTSTEAASTSSAALHSPAHVKPPFDTDSFTLPLPAAPPAFTKVSRKRRYTISRGETSYHKRGGGEIGGWEVLLYIPSDGVRGPASSDDADGARAPGDGNGAPADGLRSGSSQDGVAQADGAAWSNGRHAGSSLGAPCANGADGAPRPGAAAIDPGSSMPSVDGATDGHPAASGHDGAGATLRPLIIFLPIGGLVSDIAESYSRYFAGQGYAVLHLKRPPPGSMGRLFKSLNATAKSLAEDTVNLRRTLAWARKLPGIDPERIGVLGVSRGAIVTALAAQQDPHISTVLVIGGADLDGLLRDSRMDAVRTLWKSETARHGGDVEKLMEEASTVFRDVDPATRRGRIDPARTLLINARWDRVVPREEALVLRDVAGGATQAWLPCGHFTTLLFARKIRSLAAEHFARTLRP